MGKRKAKKIIYFIENLSFHWLRFYNVIIAENWTNKLYYFSQLRFITAKINLICYI